MRSRVVAAGFGDYAAGLRRTQPRFPLATRYALMERWNDCTHSFIFGFGEMTLTPADYTAITGLGFDARYQTAALGAELVRTLLGVPTRTRYTAQGPCVHQRGERPGSTVFHFYLISSQLLCTSQNKGDPAVLVCLRDLGRVGSYDWASLALAHLYHGLDVWTRGSGESNWQFLHPLEVWAYEYRIYPGGPGGDATADARRIPRALANEGDAWEAYPARAVPEAFTRSRILLQGYWVDRYFLGERIFELQVATAQRRVPDAPPCHMCLEGMTPEDLLEEYDGSPADVHLMAGDYASYFTTRLQARLPKDRRRHRTPAYYRVQVEADAPTGPTGAVLGDVPFPPGMEGAPDPALGLGSAIIIPADLSQSPPPLQLDPEHATHISRKMNSIGQRYFTWMILYWMSFCACRCLLRDIRSYTRGSASPRPTSPDCIRSSMRGTQVSSFAQPIPDDLWQIHPTNQLAWLKYFKDLKPEHSFMSWLVMSFSPNTMVFRFEDSEVTPTYEEMCAVMGHHPEQDETPALPPSSRHDLAEIAALCSVYLPDGINPDQGLPLEPFLNKVLSMDANPSWVRACCFLLLNMYALKNRQPGIGDFQLLTIVRDMQVYHRTVFMMIMGETMCWVRDIALHVTNFNVHHRGCPMLLQAWALDKLSLIPPVLARLIPNYGPFDLGPEDTLILGATL
ncbi:hypothetical protein JCGZ_05178 [Jatropha curcas]|uniref:Aminotransferase-like plant mobile domain-containing protein n=1 Tax=Jatropha curcas TaxID=180498 RepID=A0A067KQA3_JATCU|nr:hypothetical protein JCGZ_05178 [Jatropha curcas]